MFRQFFTLRRIGMLLVAVAFAWATFSLGQWQFGRHEAKLAARTAVETNYSADPVQLSTVLTPESPELAATSEWTAVEIEGSYLPQNQLYVRNRPFRGTYGYEVLVPFRDSAGGGTILVDRGWVENAETASILPDVPPAPEGTLTIHGWLRNPEIDLERDLPADQLASINTASASKKTDLDLLPAYLELETETTQDGQPPARPEAADKPDTGLGSHLAYAIQWWLVVPLGFILIGVLFRREVLDAREAKGAVPNKPRKTRIWDEEDE
ncbi:SURF1 family protein [Ornithinimicrobium sp. Arc0846-15]|nr:SURF1 family protein [Ornithinimicrobium laminariae]